jgi:hypothetical protein
MSAMFASTRIQPMKSVLRAALLLLIAACMSCGETGPSKPHGALVGGPGKDEGAAGASGSGADFEAEVSPDEPLSETEETERLRKMQMIRVVLDDTEFFVDITAEELGTSYESICKLRDISVLDVSELTEQCGEVYRGVRCMVSAAGELLKVAGSAHAPVPIEGFGYTITPQPAGPRHRLATLAALYMEKATRVALMALQGESIDADWVNAGAACPSGSCSCSGEIDKIVTVTPSDLLEPTTDVLGERLVSSAVEGYHVLKEAVDLAGDIGLAVADAQRSDTGSLVEGVRRQMTAQGLSRSALAHMLVGGEPGLNGSLTPEGLCTSPELSPSVQRALGLLREAALSPADVLDLFGTPIDDLLEDDYRIAGSGSASTACGSVRERLRDRWNDDTLEDTTVSIPARFGLSIADFTEARDYLVREINVFARSRTAVIDAGVCNADYDSGDPVRYPRFAATMTVPAPIDPIYWSTLARYTSSAQFPARDFFSLPFVNPFWNDFGNDPLNLSFADRGGLASVVDDFIVRAASVVRSTAAGGFTSDVEEKIGGLLNVLLADARLERSGRLYVMRWRNATFESASYAHLTVPLMWGIRSTDGVIAVAGEDGLRCAINGNIEGVTCNDTQLTALTLGSLNRDYYTELIETFEDFNYDTASATALANLFRDAMPDDGAAWGPLNTSALTEPSRIYLVRPRAGSDATPGPGEFVSITGFRHLTAAYEPAMSGDVNLVAGPRDTDVYSVLPDIDHAAARYIEPNRKWCTNPQITCAGTSFDERLSLENELTEDGNDFEDSWRHYLQLARQAADEADELGESYLQAEIDVLNTELDQVQFEDQVRERRERELDELQDICGTSMPTEKIFALLVPNGDIRDAAPVHACTGPDDPTCLSRSTSCYAGQCIGSMSDIMLKGKSDPDIHRLYQCLYSSETSELATAGNTELCVTLARGNRNRICQTNFETLDPSTCPQIKTGNQTCDQIFAPVLVTSAGDTTATVRPLNYFDTLADPPPPVGPVAVCDAFRKARGNLVSGDFRRSYASSQLQTMLNDAFFFEKVQQDAEDIGWWNHYPAGTMTYRGAGVYRASGDNWPCVDTDSNPEPRYPNQAVRSSCTNPDDPNAARDSFFCQQIDCSDPAAQGAWGRRAHWATVALRAMAYKGSPTKFSMSENKFVPAAGLDGVELLAYGPRQPPEGSTIYPARTRDPWTDGHKLRATRIVEHGLWYDQLQILRANNSSPTSAGDLYMLDPNGDPIRTDGPGNSLLATGPIGILAPPLKVHTRRVSDGLLCSDNTRVSVQQLKPAPLWWKGLSISDQVLNRAPRVEGHTCLPLLEKNSSAACVKTERPNYGNEAWIRKFLLGDIDQSSRAPLESLWYSQKLTVTRGGHDITGGIVGTVIGGALGGALGPLEVFFGGGLVGAIGDAFDCDDSDRFSFGPWIGTLVPSEMAALSLGQEPDPEQLLTMYSDEPVDTWEVNRAVLDAFEVYCHYELEYDQPPLVALDNPPAFNSLDDLDDVAEYFKIVSNELNGAAGRLVFANLPSQAIDALALNPVNSAYPALGGELAKSILALRGALIQLATAAPGIKTEIELLGNDMRELQGRLRIIDLRRDQVDIRLLAESVQRVSDCVAAASPTVTASLIPSVSVNTGAVAICANAFAQIEFSGQLSDIDDDVLQQEAALAINDFSEIIIKRREILRDYSEQIREANEIINEHLANIDLVKNKAKRALQRALFMQTEQAEKLEEISGAMRARTNLERERYERALDNARRLAFIAKRAIEQRIGMHLSELHEDLPLVKAPASWEARVCSTTGVDFDTFQKLADANPDSPRLDAFADQFIGDYVTDLENLVESYPLAFNFHEGDDTTVISLRDDVFNSKVMCDVPSGNLLYFSSDLSELVASVEADAPLDPTAAGWVLEDCALETDGTPLRDCIAVEIADADSPFPETGLAPGQIIRFGDDGAVCDYDNTADPNRCGYTETALMRQDVYIEAGAHILSWYAKGSSVMQPLFAVRNGAGAIISGAPIAAEPSSTAAWQRYYSLVTMPTPEIVSIVLRQPTSAPETVTVAAVMLEDAADKRFGDELVPRPYVRTDTTLDRTIAACADTFGAGFAQHWKFKCANLCPNGFGAACGSDSSSTRCYHELSFGISQREIERGALLGYAGFAKGNFNYRLDELAVNFVGTKTRDCSRVSAGSCYAAGFIPYSIQHDGPFFVRNHIGGDFEAKIFPGAIEHARGLAAERVVTNPISSADRDLLQDYQRRELRGRPLDGVFTLRVWEEPGVSFSAIEDVQLVLKYRYWTRFE